MTNGNLPVTNEFVDIPAHLNPQSVQFQQAGLPGDTLGGGLYDLGAVGTFGNHLWTNFWGRDETQKLPAWWSPLRDKVLRRYARENTVLGSIIYGRVQAIKNLSWDLSANNKDDEPALEYYKMILDNAQFGMGFREFLERWVLDYYTQDNGAFVDLARLDPEIPIRNPLSGQLLGYTRGYLDPRRIAAINVYDAAQCYRTYNPMYPVIYTQAWTGKRIILHWSRVIVSSQFTSNQELARGLGYCAVSRAFEAAEIIRYSNEYVIEKMGGMSPEILITQGIPLRNIKEALNDNLLERDARGFHRYKGHLFLPGDATPNGEAKMDKVGLRSTPDGWDRKAEIELAVHMLAMAFGTDSRDLGWPATSTGATKADAEIQDLKTSNLGRGDAIRDIEDWINRRILPKGITFEFEAKNELEELKQAEISQLRMATRTMALEAGLITVDEAREMAALDGDIPPELLRVVNVVDDTDAGDVVLGQEDDPVPEFEGVQIGNGNSNYQHLSEKSVNTYERTLTRLGNAYAKGEIDLNTFREQMRETIAKQMKLAWDAAKKELGTEATGLDTDAELFELIEDELEYVEGLAHALYMSEKGLAKAIRNRLKLWANGFMRLKNAALATLGGGVNLQWRLGDTEEHCADCLAFDGLVFKGRQWKEAGALPQSHDLECNGYNCDCALVPTTKALSPGQPLLIGSKEHTHPTDTKAARYEGIDFSPPEGVRKAAARGLELRSEFGRGGTSVGIARARDLSNGKTISPSTARRMHSFFSRHSAFEKNHETNPPSNSYISWLLWGGDAGRAWAAKLTRQMDARE